MVVAVDAIVLLAASRGLVEVTPLSTSLLNASLILFLNRPGGNGLAGELKALPALAAAGTIVVQVSGSRIRLFEMLSASPIPKVSEPFRSAVASCYRGEGVEETLEAAAASLPYQGLSKGIKRLGGGQGVETVKSEAALSGLDLDRYYLSALETIETRISLLQAAAFFSPMISLIAFPRFFAGPFDATVLCFFALSALRFASGALGA